MLNADKEKQLSKFMSKMLRHTPELYGLSLDPADGSCTLDELLQAIRKQAQWSGATLDDVKQVTANSDKQRYEITGDRIRARYGHSHDKVQYEAGTPPLTLFHGTNLKAAPIILREGIRPMSRQYVHLSEGTHFASLAGKRRGELVILSVDTAKAAGQGVKFYYAGNEVWLADFIPPACCAIKEENEDE